MKAREAWHTAVHGVAVRLDLETILDEEKETTFPDQFLIILKKKRHSSLRKNSG